MRGRNKKGTRDEFRAREKGKRVVHSTDHRRSQKRVHLSSSRSSSSVDGSMASSNDLGFSEIDELDDSSVRGEKDVLKEKGGGSKRDG